MDSHTQEFISKFQALENLLKRNTGSDDNISFKEALRVEAKRNSYVEKNYPLIEDLYALRNVFSHRERGKYVAAINSLALKELDKIINALSNPPLVSSIFHQKVYQAHRDQDISAVMSIMKKNVYTHVPIWYDSLFVGVFSYSSFFEWLAWRQITEKTEVTFAKKIMGDIDRQYLNPPSVNFRFIPEMTNIYQIMPLFDEAIRKQQRLDCLLITPYGKIGEKITGIITSWDLASIH